MSSTNNPAGLGESGGVRSVQRAFDILSLLTEDRRTLTIREVVDETGLAKTTALRLLQTLEHMGLLWATPKGYAAGPALWRWAHLARHAWELPPETVALMRELGARHRETVNLYVLRDVHRVCIAQQESPQPLRHVVRVGDELPLWAGASSKILLRDAPAKLLTRIARSSPHGEGHVATLREWADQAARDGYAASHGEREPGLSAVAVPVLGGSQATVAALSLSGPTVRFGADRVAEFAADLRDVAKRMSERGFDHPLT
ncbi:DNA-binding transcriptional regulator, IclR family [Nonomuraea solani]|uniref:DNA-binding transcriptional regulator, IclR family n=1 Tax=Nonomuraea solani TaxID=1144553 RepID=A0A1H6DRI7_9ACTN|nr:IclR family transcriptional regulator [Nonomuraea solani]SEG87987.1 DNA-binding transcriptional regulator, IclR family [Nonomuraea solani]